MPSRNTRAPSNAARRRIVQSRLVYRGRAFQVARETVREPGLAQPLERDIVRHGPSAVILPARPDGAILLVRQYRHAAGRSLWELPAGTVDAGETPLACARRELTEETGYQARRWRLWLRFFPSPGLLDEEMFVYVAAQLMPGACRPEDDERIETRWFSRREWRRLLDEGRIHDGKTLAALASWRAARPRP